MSKKTIKEIIENHCGTCGWFSDGQCRKQHRSAGFFELACEDYLEKIVPISNTFSNEPAPATKVCKTCGRELTLDHFGGHHRTADRLQASCKECMNAKIKKGQQERWDKASQPKAKKAPKTELDEILDKAEPMPIQEPKVKYEPARDLDDYTPQELYDELCRRGWTGTLTKVETLQPAF